MLVEPILRSPKHVSFVLAHVDPGMPQLRGHADHSGRRPSSNPHEKNRADITWLGTLKEKPGQNPLLSIN